MATSAPGAGNPGTMIDYNIEHCLLYFELFGQLVSTTCYVLEIGPELVMFNRKVQILGLNLQFRQ